MLGKANELEELGEDPAGYAALEVLSFRARKPRNVHTKTDDFSVYRVAHQLLIYGYVAPFTLATLLARN